MSSIADISSQLRRELDETRARLSEAKEAIDAIRNGEVDGLVTSGPEGRQIFTLDGAQEPYRLLIEQMSEGAMTLSPDGTVLYTNQTFANAADTAGARHRREVPHVCHSRRPSGPRAPVRNRPTHQQLRRNLHSPHRRQVRPLEAGGGFGDAFVMKPFTADTLLTTVDRMRSASGRPQAPILTVLDTDHDGSLSAVEIAAAPLALTALDLNEDGIISPDERRGTDATGQPVRFGHRATSSTVMLALDANFDGDLQPLEVANAVSSLQRLDRNSDGELTPNELRPVMVARNR